MKIGVLGHGSIGTRHADNILSIGHGIGWYDPINGWIRRDELIEWADAIVVASPSKEHAHDLMDAVNAGKHVLVEKPFGYDCPPLLDGFVQGARMKHPELIIATGFNLRFHVCVRKAKEMLPELGAIRTASFSVLQKTDKAPYLRDGILRNWCSHEIDLAHYLLGDGEVISCVAPADELGNDSVEATITMKFNNVADKVHINADYFSNPEHRFFWIEGDRATIYVNLVRREVLFKEHSNHVPKLILTANDSYDANYLEEMEYFIRSIEEGKHLDPLATAEDGIKALYTVMACREKAKL